ncbi:MAG: AI-2E family transporter [Anaerolineales bacterium]|nr:AI-2E family transporter [Anaerolineales bacterium]
MTKQLIVIVTAVMTTVLALIALWQFHVVVIYIFISLALAATVRPLIKDLSSHSLIMRLSLILLYVFILSGFVYLITQVGRFVIGDIEQLSQTLAVQDKWILPTWLKSSSFEKVLIARLPVPSILFEAITGEQGQLVLPALLGFTQGIGSVISGIFLVLLLSIYWSINQIHFERLWLSLLPSELRKQARGIWRKIEPDLGAYIRSEIAQSILAGFLLGIGYWFLGSQYPILLALIAAFALLIPVVGGILAVILPLAIGLLTSVQLSLLSVFYTLIVVIALQIWIEPRLYKRQADNPILTLVIILALADAFGLIGIIIAPPLSAICQILWSHLVTNRLTMGASAQVSDLKERQKRLWTIIKNMEEQPPPLIISSMERLAELIAKADPIVQTTIPVIVSEPFHPSQPVSNEDK